MQESNRAAELEAVLFAAGNPVTLNQLTKVLELDNLSVSNLMEELTEELDKRKSGLTVRQVAGGYQMVTRPEYYFAVERLGQVEERKLSAPTMETLSIIAFKQPITKQEIEQIRGVRAERAIAKLLELELICEQGRKQVVGRPILYGTTEAFLECFGLNGLEDLPILPSTEEAADGMDVEQLALLDEGLVRNDNSNE